MRVDTSGSLNPILELAKKNDLEYQESKFENISIQVSIVAFPKLSLVSPYLSGRYLIHTFFS